MHATTLRGHAKRLSAIAFLLALLVGSSLAVASESSAVPPIPSFTIDDAGTIDVPGRDVVTVAGAIECAAGQTALVLFAAEQRSAFGDPSLSSGTTTIVCTGGIDRWAIAAVAGEYARPGHASIVAVAIVGSAARSIERNHFVVRPAQRAVEPISVTVTAPSTILIDDIVTVTATVRDGLGVRMDGVTVVFTTDNGMLNPTFGNTVNGDTSVQWSKGSTTEVGESVTVTASAQGRSGSATFSITGATP